MPQLVDVDGLGTVEFPDDFTPAQIEAAWQSELKPLIEAKRTAAQSQQRIVRGRNAAALPEISPIEEGFKGAGRALESAAGNVARGLTRAVVSPLQTAGTIADHIRTKTGDVGSYKLGPDKRSGLTQLAEGIEQKVAEYGPSIYEEQKDQFLAGDVASGIGQVSGMMLGGGAAGLAAKGLGKAAIPAAMAATTTMGFTGEFGDAFERAKARGDDADTALAKAMGYASVAALIENKLGAGRLLKKWMPDPSEAVVALTKAGVAKEVLKDLVVGYGEEALQRAAQDLIVDGKLDPEGINREGLAGGFVQALVGAPAAGRRYQPPNPKPGSPSAAVITAPTASAPTPVPAPQTATPQAAPVTPAATRPTPTPAAPVVQPIAEPIQQAPPQQQLAPPTAAQRSELEDIRGDLEAAQLAGDTERVQYLSDVLRQKEREAWTKKVTAKPRRTAITPAAQAAAPKRTAALPEAPSLPEPLEGQPYDTRLATRPEATMPARPVGELGIERGRVSPVDPDLAAAVEDIRGGYAERTARELGEGAQKPDLAAPKKSRLELILDGVQRTGKEFTIEVTDPNRENLTRILNAAEVRGLSASTDGRFILIRAAATTTPTETTPAAVKRRTKQEKPMAATAARTSVDPKTDELLGTNDRGEPIYWSANAKTHYAISDGRIRTAPDIAGLQESAIDKLQRFYAPQEQAPVEVLRNQPPGTPAQVAEGKPGAVSQAAGEGAKEAPEQTRAVEDVAALQSRRDATEKKRKAEDAKPRKGGLRSATAIKLQNQVDKLDADIQAAKSSAQAAAKVAQVDPGEQQVLDEIAKLNSVTGPLNSSERTDLNELRLSAQNKKLSRLSQAYLENLEERAVGTIPKEGIGSIYKMDRRGETKWLVQQGEKRGFGDSIFDTEQEAVAESSREATRREQRAESLRKLDAEKSAEASAKAEREDLGTFTDGMSPMKRGAVVKQLTAKFRYLGKEMSRRDIIRELVNQGRKVEVEEGQRVLSNDQGEYLGEKVLTKAGLDYAEHLIRERDAQMSLGQTPTARPAPSLSKMQVEQAVRELFDGNTPPNFQVTHNYGKVFNGREVRGWYDPATGTIWLNAAYLRSPQEARAVFIEEAFHAIQNDKAVQTELSRLVASLTPEQLSSAKAAYGNISEEQLRMEAVADILEQQQLTQEQRGILARLWDAVLGAVQRLYGKFTGKVFTERDAQDVLAKALKAAAVGRRSLKNGGEVYAEGGLAAKAKAFFSRLFRTVEQSQQNKASGAQWKATIKNSKLGANLDEMALVGVNDLEDGKVYSRQEVLDYLQANQVEVKDVTLGGKASGYPLWLKEQEQVFLKNPDVQRSGFNLSEEFYNKLPIEYRKKYDAYAEPKTYFSRWQLPGANEGSYREVLLTVPKRQIPDTTPQWERMKSALRDLDYLGFNNAQEAWEAVKNDKDYAINFDIPKEAQNAIDDYRSARLALQGLNWSDGHAEYSSIANPIVRLRFNERQTQDGKRMLFLEEVQAPQKGQFEKMPALFQKNWREIAFKWALRHAAENGFEVIGWTTGEQQAERYDLSKQVDSVGVIKRGNGTFYASVRKNGSIVAEHDYDSVSELSNAIGKDLAEKASNQEVAKLNTYSGLDLKVGGEGLKKLYDVDFRNVVGKLPAVRNAGGKVGSSAFSESATVRKTNRGWTVWANGERVSADDTKEVAEQIAAKWNQEEPSLTVHALPITPAIADSVMGGQAMFSTGSHQNQLDQQYFEAIQRGDMREAQRLVDEAAMGAGYNVGPVWHGTNTKGFNVFDIGMAKSQAAGKGFYFTNSERYAARYGANLLRAYLSLQDPVVNDERGVLESGRDTGEGDGRWIKGGFPGLRQGEQIFLVRNASQIKSADPITRDGSGSIIPLSQRFQQESPDIRYSLGAPVSQSDATEVQGRAIEPSIVAAASRAVADLGRQTVEEFEQAGRQLEGLAYESKQFRQARSELNNLVSLHEGRLRQLPQDRVTDDMRANIRDGVSIENGQIVVGDDLVTKLAQMGVQFRPELVKALQAEVHFEQQARRLVDNLGKLATLKELKDYYTNIKAPADEILKLDKLIAAKEKVVANLTPVTTNRGRGQQSIGERASEITRANASKVELQAKRDALTLEPVQEFFGKGITELRDLSEKAKAAADLTRALMDSSTSISEVARLGEIYDKWASFDRTVKDALKKGTLTDEQRTSVLTSLQRSFDEFDVAKSQMDDLLNSEEKGLLKDIRLAEADIADAKVTSGLADVLVADALKAAKGEMGLTGTVGDAANIANLEASTGAITTLAANLGRTIDQNRWLYDFLMAPGDMPAFGASVAQSLGISETALREVLKVVQQSPSLASAIVTLTDDAAAKLANSPPNQMQSIATLATTGNPVAMALAANLTSQIVQQANAQGTKANAARQAAARQLAQSVLRLRTLQQGQALFSKTANSPAFQQLRSAVATGASEAQKMVVLGPTGPVLRGFKSAAKEYQPELKIDVDTSALELSKTRDKVWKYLQNAEQYVADYEAAAALYTANPANPSPSQLGFDVADYNGLKFAIENQIAPMFLNMGDMDDTARAAQYLTPVGVRKFMKLPAFLGQIFNQYEQLGKMVGGFAGNTFRQQIAKYKRGYLNAKGVASQFQDLPKLQSAAMQSHNIRSEDTYRRIFNEVAHYGRLFGTPLRVGFKLPISNQIVTKADMEFLKRTLAFEEKLRREVTEIDPVTGVRYMRGGKEITRKGAYTGDLGMPRHMNRGATQFIADVTNAYAGTPKGFTPTIDLSASSQDEAVKYWNEHLGTLKQHILDSLRTDRSFKQSAEMAAAEKRIAARWLAGNMNQVNSVQDLVDLIAAEIPTTSGKNPLDTAREGLNNELLQYVAHAERIKKERAEDNAKTSGLSIALSSENEYTKPAAYLELPSEYYDYGAVSSIDRITAQARSNHSALIDFANSIRLAITELESRMAQLNKATTDKQREAILENYKGNPQEMEDVLELLRDSLKNFEDSYRAGGPDLVPTRLGQKILKATVGSVLAKVEIAIRNLSQGQLQVFTNLRAMNYMSAKLAAWKALSNVPRGMINTSYMVARNIAGFADRRLGRDPQFQRTLKGAVDVVADGIFKTAQAALFKPMVGAENVRKSFERVFNLGFDTSGDSWDAIKQAWIDSGQFRNQIEQDEAMKTRTSRAINLLDRLANTALDSVNAVVRGSVLESSDTGMNALSLGLVGNMEQRLEEVAMVFGKRLTDLGITRIDPTDKRAVLQANEWLPSLNQQTAANSLGEIRKFLESSASSEGFSLEQNLLKYYQDAMAGRPAEIFNQRTFDAVQRSMIAENNAALPTNRASAGQASTLWRTLLTLQGYPADAFLKMMRIAAGGTRDRKAVLQAASKISLALGVAALAIIVQGSGDAGAELWKRKMQGKRADRPTPLDADFYTDPDHLKRAMGNYLLLSSYYVGDIIRGAYGWVDGRSTIDPLQKAFALATASQIARDISSGVKIAMKGGTTAEVLEPLRKSIARLTFGAPELEQLLGKERDNSEAARRGITENAKAKGFDLPAPGFGGTVGLTNIKRKALSQAVSDMEIAQRKGDTEGYAKAKAAAQKQITELEAYYLKQRLEAGDSPEVAAKTAKASVWGDYQENNPVTAALGGKRPTAEQYKQLVESSTGERGGVIRQGIKAWQDGAQALFGKPGNITKEDVAENRPGGTVREPSYGRVSLTGGVSGRMRSVGTVSSRGRRAKIRRVSLTGRRRKISPIRSRRKKIRRVRLTA